MNNNEQLERIIAEALTKAGKTIEPRKELLAEIIAKTPVTEAESLRYKVRGEGRASIIDNLIKNFNIMNWKILAPSALVVVLSFFFIYSQGGLEKKSFEGKSAARQNQAVSVSAEPAGETALLSQSADELTGSILAGVSDEDLTISDEESDLSLFDADSAAIDNYVQSYDAEGI
jgi:hypothetical protein